MAYREILERQMEYERFLIRQFRERLEQNVKARERYLGACKPFDYASVSGCLPKVRHPDFTMPIAPWFPFYMEYKGLYQKEGYRKRDEETMLLYHLNGIYSPKNLLVFMEGPDGSFHADSILRAINGILVSLWEEFH